MAINSEGHEYIPIPLKARPDSFIGEIEQLKKRIDELDKENQYQQSTIQIMSERNTLLNDENEKMKELLLDVYWANGNIQRAEVQMKIDRWLNNHERVI